MDQVCDASVATVLTSGAVKQRIEQVLVRHGDTDREAENRVCSHSHRV